MSLENDQEPFRFSRGCITQMSFSHDSQYLATADDTLSVTVYKRSLRNEERVWERLGGLRSHYKLIRTV
uniref:Uncharacterized protein n=1 Tax=Sphenodon punctatus TaxID=8508 RepID=A0A8D0L893_SPHPU